MDPRITKLAEIVVNYSIKVQEGDTIIIQGGLESKDLILECSRLILQKGAIPRTKIILPDQHYTYYKHVKEKQLKKLSKIDLFEARNSEGYILIKDMINPRELSNVDPKKIAMTFKKSEPLKNIRLKQDNWVIVGFPTISGAQEASMSLKEFQDFVFGTTNLDWEKEGKKQEKLKRVVDKGKQVRILGKETDLTFSIKNMTGIICKGERNMPDGEVFTAPVVKSVNGTIYYEFPAIYNGREVTGVKLTFKDGKVVKATAEKNEEYLKQMITMDKGSSYLGEFGIGTNFGINRFIKSILFDEKIGGTIHLALGSAYEECGKGGNKSALHWDMIKDLRNSGKFLIDGKVILKNGKFLI
jgi:aminopeptidase